MTPPSTGILEKICDLDTRFMGREILDELDRSDPRARQSRQDLRRLNQIMFHILGIRSLVRQLHYKLARGLNICELGCGDAWVGEQVWIHHSFKVHPGSALTLLDMQPSVSPDRLDRLSQVFEEVSICETSLMPWLDSIDPGDKKNHFDLVVMNLFLHHFTEPQIQRIFRGLSKISDAVICLEPRRSALGLMGAKATGLIGCNEVTRHDAALSVRAGFTQHELSTLWGHSVEVPLRWQTFEHSFGPFSHFFHAETGK